jgi:predicted transposase/invertase (TIGR01784 family)
MLTERYINLFTDFGFKRIFGTESNKELLLDFLNTILNREQNPIVEITYLKNELLGKKKTERVAIFDLYCESSTQERFIIELQRTAQDFFKDRLLYYASHAIQGQAKKGRSWDYELLPIYSIAITDFVVDTANAHYASLIKLVNTQTQEIFHDKLVFLYIEMPKFNKERNELKTNTDKWLYVFKNMHKLDTMPIEVQQGVFLKLFEECKIANYTPKEYMQYEESLKHYRDWYAISKSLKREGKEEGLIEGMQKGIQKGIQEGIQKGKQEGKQEGLIEGMQKGIQKGKQEGMQAGMQQAIRETAKKMKASGFDLKTIAEITRLSETEINEL